MIFAKIIYFFVGSFWVEILRLVHSFGSWAVGVSGMLETSSFSWKSDGFDKKSNDFWSIFVHSAIFMTRLRRAAKLAAP